MPGMIYTEGADLRKEGPGPQRRLAPRYPPTSANTDVGGERSRRVHGSRSPGPRVDRRIELVDPAPGYGAAPASVGCDVTLAGAELGAGGCEGGYARSYPRGEG